MNVSALWPAHGVDPLNHWGVLAGALGCSPSLERPFLICLRNVLPYEIETHPMRSVAEYDDTGILLFPGGQHVFKMSSHAYQVNSKLSPDVDGDGRGDVGTIKPGRYVLRDMKAGKYPTFHLTTPEGSDRIPCARDTNHDGIITHNEESEAWTATAILLHGGVDDPPDSPHHYSIGCQCVPLIWRREIAARCAPGGIADYVLIRAEDAVKIVGAAPELENVT